MKVTRSSERSGSSRRRHSQRGSALLIVFVFAAFVAIMLYREMPVFAFEAQRQKEEMLVDRGAQYKRGVKLFYKKFGMFPASLDQLENTNRLRFLRHRFKDPLTGKDDWRLLHMGPGGMLIDSKVKQLSVKNLPGNVTAVASNSGFGTNSGFGNTSNSTATSSFGAATNSPASSAFGGSSRGSSRASTSSGFGSSTNSASSSGFGSNSSNSSFSSFGSSSFSSFGAFGSGSGSDQGGVVVKAVPKRAPAVAANGGASAANVGGAGAPSPDQAGQNQPDELAQAEQSAGATQPGQQPGPGEVAQPNPGDPDQTGQPQPVQNNAQPGVAQTSPGAGAQGANSMNAIRRMLTNPNAQAQVSPRGRFRAGGGLAGVASKAEGHTIKVINDQVDYSLWEFYYDPSKDVKQGLPGGAGMGVAPGSGTNTFNRTLSNANVPAVTRPAPAPAPVQNADPDPNPNPIPENPPDEPENPGDTDPNGSLVEPPQ
jgi:hypothetical protein